MGDNEPYSGRLHAFSVEHHAGAAGLPRIGIEVRQDLVETADGVAHWLDLLAESLEATLAVDSLAGARPD